MFEYGYQQPVEPTPLGTDYLILVKGSLADPQLYLAKISDISISSNVEIDVTPVVSGTNSRILFEAGNKVSETQYLNYSTASQYLTASQYAKLGYSGSSNYGGLYLGIQTPSTTNYTLSANNNGSGDLYIQGYDSILFQLNQVSQGKVVGQKWSIGGGHTASAFLHIVGTTEQLRSGYDASNYLKATTDSAGNTTIDLVGTSPTFTFGKTVSIAGDLGTTGGRVTKGWFTDLEVTNYYSVNGVTQDKSSTDATSATPTPIGDGRRNFYYLTALGGGATFAAPSGTPANGNTLIIRIKDDGTSRSLAYNGIYRAIGITLPTATTISKTIYLGCIYNSADSKWDVTAYALQA